MAESAKAENVRENHSHPMPIFPFYFAEIGFRYSDGTFVENATNPETSRKTKVESVRNGWNGYLRSRSFFLTEPKSNGRKSRMNPPSALLLRRRNSETTYAWTLPDEAKKGKASHGLCPLLGHASAISK